jgi:hypothetical protein
LFVWVYVAKGQDTTILVLGYPPEKGEKSHSRADSIRFNFSEQGAGIAAAGSRIGSPGFYACDVQPWLGGLLLHLKPCLKRPNDQPEASPEVALSVTLTALTFTAQAQGMVLIYDDSTHTLLSTEMQRRRRKPELLWRKRFYWAVNR